MTCHQGPPANRRSQPGVCDGSAPAVMVTATSTNANIPTLGVAGGSEGQAGAGRVEPGGRTDVVPQPGREGRERGNGAGCPTVEVDQQEAPGIAHQKVAVIGPGQRGAG